MKTIFETCVPSEEVIEGEVKADIFAAKLGDVVANKSPDVYQNPDIFFDNTYPTDGLKTLLSEAFGRLSGVKPANSPVIRLETSFGGGKMHNLIALYHIARIGSSIAEADKFIPEAYIPSTLIATAVLVGTDLDPSSGVRHGGVITYTLWGELAYQLAGKAGYELMKANDTDKTAPGTDVLDRILEEKPALIIPKETVSDYIDTVRTQLERQLSEKVDAQRKRAALQAEGRLAAIQAQIRELLKEYLVIDLAKAIREGEYRLESTPINATNLLQSKLMKSE